VSIALDGDRIVVGASRDDEQASDAGAVYLFSTASGSWQQQAKVIADDGVVGDALGFSVVLGSYGVAGAEMLDLSDNGMTLTDAGGAYVLDIPIFSDGFDSGDATAWDAAVSEISVADFW
jgi:hypothetical protein